jgi:hypothetical protein
MADGIVALITFRGFPWAIVRSREPALSVAGLGLSNDDRRTVGQAAAAVAAVARLSGGLGASRPRAASDRRPMSLAMQ